ncbi:60S ribosomal protein L18a-1 [Acorus calamus]|uniref:60S ribosomal protein L18a-1 n=1 Tax=Acorus calamus TaxID=4465 RepID=A0AAV9DPK0_ACOCL|nr:60S ribosomal protein L18a-1 [Acorus calamus]KAK1302851.1 60S ribosomal protein L18a-1 [Acorus calamus]
MSDGEEKGRGIGDHLHQQQQPPQYGTFQGVPPTQPAIGFPQPVPPPGLSSPPGPSYYSHGYQAAVPGYVAVAEGRPVREHRLPCCGIGLGWLLFIIGFFLGGIPWYVGAFIILCARVDYREKPGFIACSIAAVLTTIAVIFGATHDW